MSKKRERERLLQQNFCKVTRTYLYKFQMPILTVTCDSQIPLGQRVCLVGLRLLAQSCQIAEIYGTFRLYHVAIFFFFCFSLRRPPTINYAGELAETGETFFLKKHIVKHHTS